jgi:hypothetical protein
VRLKFVEAVLAERIIQAGYCLPIENICILRLKPELALEFAGQALGVHLLLRIQIAAGQRFRSRHQLKKI